MKTALIFGVTGQDGSYLSEYLLELGYKVYGVSRRVSTDNTQRISHLFTNKNFKIIEGDITDSGSVYSIIQNTSPDNIFNLAAMSHVATSFNQPQFTFDVNTRGCLNVLEAVRHFSPHSRVLYAGSSEQFGSNYDTRIQNGMSVRIQDEETKFAPRSPYAVSKVAAHLLMKNYRESYGLHTNVSICMNHESERRGENFVTRKITKWIAKFLSWAGNSILEDQNEITFEKEYIRKLHPIDSSLSSFPKLRLGNINAYRDFGYSGDYVKAMHLMLQQDYPDDYVISTGETHSVSEFLQEAFAIVGIENFTDYIFIDPAFFRPAEVDYLCGSSRKIQEKLGWVPTVRFKDLVKIMVLSDLDEEKIEKKDVT